MSQLLPLPHAASPSRRAAILAILAITLYRILLLAFDTTDLFVDESQYWAWSQHLNFGYYSKPPLVAWVIRLTTELGGSNSRFWVRLGGPLCHMATALLLMQAAARLAGEKFAPWVGLSFITLPAVALSSVFISTDTVMFVFLAGALVAYAGLIERSSLPRALVFGACVGMAMLGKYSMVFVVGCMGLAALLMPRARVSWRDGIVSALTALLVFSPNVWWNLTHDIATVRHTSENVNWQGLNLHIRGALEFFLAQFAVVGPVLFGALIWAGVRALKRSDTPLERHLALLTWPIVLAFVAEALISRAYANWAVQAYAAGTILATILLLTQTKRGIVHSFRINLFATIVFPIVCIFAAHVALPGGDSVLKRYLGRAALSQEIAATAREAGATVIVAENRDILADLFYTLNDQGFTLAARREDGFPRHYYEQNFALDPATPGPVLYASVGDLTCKSGEARALKTIRPTTGYWRKREITLYLTDAACLAP
ncbi:ArnT family glycosyltransferase [Rhizobium rhizosphaerae]|uniref:ArnT family glycosyltransferase n=1 Tax=Xaviernesmea rhizosphaerae TaxID=1672749 RepID=UPI001FD8CBB4|nr:glycosyltransferase family 39 protein [Xaviernesmea rhizosphaerae]